MSKAEEKAMQYCCTKCANNKLNCGMKLLQNGQDCIKCGNYIKGYNQAEKDLELTWEDIETIGELRLNVALELRRKELESPIKNPLKFTTEDMCKEVLKRFKTMKETKD